MVNSPVVSIITACYNSEDYLPEAFESVIKQTFDKWEWIIVDDCSTDKSRELISKYVKKDRRIKLFQMEKNSGSAAARNVGLRQAKGRYITFLDSDDFLDDNYLESQVGFISNNGPIITSGYRRLAQKSNTIFMPRLHITYRKLLYGCDTSCLTTMYDKTIFGDHYFDETMRKDEDYVFWLNMLSKGYVVQTNQKVLATYRIRKQSKNGNKLKLLKPIYNVYRRKLGFNIFRTIWHIVCYFLYGIKKYRNVK